MTISIQSSEIDEVAALAKTEIQGVSVLRERANTVVSSAERVTTTVETILEESRPRIARILKLAEILVSVTIVTVMLVGATAIVMLIL